MQTTMNADLVKRVRNLTISEGADSDTILDRRSTVKLYGGNTSRM